MPEISYPPAPVNPEFLEVLELVGGTAALCRDRLPDSPSRETILMQVETNAGILYTLYCEEVGGKAYNGDPLPDWENFRKDPAKAVQANAWRQLVFASEVLSEIMHQQ